LSNVQDVASLSREIQLNPSFDGCKKIVLSIIGLLDDEIKQDDLELFELFTDDGRKLAANSSWFISDPVVKDHLAAYNVYKGNKLNIDFKLFGLSQLSKRVISWSQALTPNYEDEPFYQDLNLGIDFVVPKSFDRVIVVLSKNYVVRTLEIHGEMTATYLEIFSKWKNLENFDNKLLVHTLLWESFDLSPINQKFYEGIQQHYVWLCQYLIDKSRLDSRHSAQFANRLLGRIIFVWFLDKKGLISKKQGYFDSQSHENGLDYYKVKLERLFFEVLNKQISDRSVEDIETPYLNGGLFEVRTFDLHNSEILGFPSNYFDSLYEFLHSYNFTTDESTSQFQQVAIDPEMLGRIFENLLAEIIEETGDQARKAKGAFYTPREIVDYMCREGLKKYLKNKLKQDEFIDTRLHQLIEAPDREFQDQDHNWRRDWKPYKDQILKALDELKVLDPACGSGAYPMGMVQLLIKVYERLEPRFDHHKAKLQILEKNIYGIDIEPMAVEISRLRAWLSIVVDADSTSSSLKPLPNLDFKFVCANTLTALDDEKTIMFGEDPELANKLESIREKYFNTEVPSKKSKLKVEYETLVSMEVGLFGESKRTSQLKTYRPFDSDEAASFFDGDQMFGFKKFDVILANPPYINSQTMVKNGQKEFRDSISKSYKYAKGNWDIYIAFFERGLEMLSDDGVLIYITPDKWLSKRFGDALREGSISRIESILIAGRKVFSSANVDSIITVIGTKDTNTLEIFGFDGVNVYLKRSEDKSNLQKPYILDYLFSDHVELLLRLENECRRLDSIAHCETSVYINDSYRLKPLIFELSGDFDSSTQLKLINTGTISKFVDRWGISEVTYLGEKYLKPTVNRKEFEELFDNAYSQKSVKPKLVVKGLNLLDACLDESGNMIPGIPTLVVQSGNFDDLLFSLAIINSNFASFYLKERFPASSYNQGTTFTVDMINGLPIPEIISMDLRAKILELVRKVLKSKKANPIGNTQDLELELNSIIYELYGLSKDEIALFESKR
jgi:type I restriction-modification system DNA methylase subunit